MILVKSDSVPPVLIQWTPEVDFLVKAVSSALSMFGLVAVITSGMEGTHTRASEHYYARAVDFRIVWTKTQETAVLTEVAIRLGKRGKLILESDHLHTEAV